MKNLIIIVLLFLINSCNGQENKNNQKSKREMITEQFNFQEYKNREQSDNTTYYTNDILVEEIVAKFPIVKEFHPNDYFKRVKIFYPNGSIHKIGKILGENVEFDNWKIYNEKGELTSEENKNKKFDKITPKELINILLQRKIINQTNRDALVNKDGSSKIDFAFDDVTKKWFVTIIEGERLSPIEFQELASSTNGEPSPFRSKQYIVDGKSGEVEEIE